MTVSVQGLDAAALSSVERNGLAVLAHLTPADLAALKHLLNLGMPAVVGPQTLAAFLELCRTKGLDLSDAGVNAFKEGHHLGNTGANAGAIGAQTAAAILAVVAVAPPTPSPGRRITPRGLAVIENFEGYSAAAYYDQVGVLTIGWGHTAGVYRGQLITRAQAEQLLRADVAIAEEAVNRLVKTPLIDNQFDALVSLTFNIGTGAFGASTLLRLLNAGDLAGAAAQFDRWVNGDKGPLPGLVARRAEERALFTRPA